MNEKHHCNEEAVLTGTAAYIPCRRNLWMHVRTAMAM